MPVLQVEVISDEIEKVKKKYEELKDELETNIMIQTFEGTNRHILTFVYVKDKELEVILSGVMDYPKEKFILSVLSELSHEGVVKSLTVLKSV